MKKLLISSIILISLSAPVLAASAINPIPSGTMEQKVKFMYNSLSKQNEILAAQINALEIKINVLTKLMEEKHEQ